MKGIKPRIESDMKTNIFAGTVITTLLAAPALAHDASAHARVVLAADTQATACGHKGSIRQLRQSIAIDTGAAATLASLLSIPHGETVRLTLRNPSNHRQLVVLGSADKLLAFEQRLSRFPNKEYVAPNLVYIEPQQTTQLIWQYTPSSTCRLQVYTRSPLQSWRRHAVQALNVLPATPVSVNTSLSAFTEPQS